MENTVVETYLASDTAAPKRSFLRSDGALYVVLLAAVIGIIMLGNFLSALWELPRFYVQLTLYALLIALGYAVYRCCLVSFRYVLTDRMLSVSRVVGKKVRPEANLHLSDIVSIRPLSPDTETEKRIVLSPVGKGDRIAVTCSVAGTRRTLILAPSEAFYDALIAQWRQIHR